VAGRVYATVDLDYEASIAMNAPEPPAQRSTLKTQDSKLPLTGIRLLDLGTRIAAPFAATLLADFGAEVIKVELPGSGDFMRGIGPFADGYSLWWAVEGRGKKSITLDLRTPRGQELLKRLVAGADVVYTDAWSATGLSPDLKALAGYTVDAKVMRAAERNALFMHALSAPWGEEVAREVVEGPQSVVLDQAENRRHVQKALLLELVGVRSA